MKTIRKILQNAQALSAEVLIAGLACLSLALQISGSSHRPVYYFIFGGSLWIIYTADHLLDAIHSPKAPANHRHLFHKKYFVPISVFWATLIGLVLYFIAVFLPLQSLLLGCLLGMLSLIHLALAQSKRFTNYPKEFVVAGIFSGGVWLLPLSLNRNIFYFLHGHWSLQKFADAWKEVLAFFLLFLSAYSNLLMLALFERKEDRLSGFSSEVLAGGLALSRKKLYTNFCLLLFLLVCYLLVSRDFLSALAFLLTGSTPLLLLHFFKSMKRRQMYRFLGDLVFWLYFLPVLF